MATLNHHTNHHEVTNMTDTTTGPAPMVTTTTVEVHYIYRHEDDADWALALYWWEGDTKADVHANDGVHHDRGRVIGQWRFPLGTTTFDVSDYAADILAEYAPEVMA